MRLGDDDDVLDVGLPRAREIPARIGAVDPPAHGNDDARFNRLRIAIVLADIGRAAMFGRDGEATPAVADDLSRGAVPMQKDDAHAAMLVKKTGMAKRRAEHGKTVMEQYLQSWRHSVGRLRSKREAADGARGRSLV